MEVGNIVFSHVVQKGYVKADGQELYREDYPLLFQFAQENNLLLSETDWGNGRQGMYSFSDGNMMFRVPDLRGQFLRAFDDGRGVDTARALGSEQGDAIRNIKATFGAAITRTSTYTQPRPTPTGATTYSVVDMLSDSAITARNDDSFGVSGFDASLTVPTAAENRPKNIALIAQIKY